MMVAKRHSRSPVYLSLACDVDTQTATILGLHRKQAVAEIDAGKRAAGVPHKTFDFWRDDLAVNIHTWLLELGLPRPHADQLVRDIGTSIAEMVH
jgi:hypothetical protein